MRFISSVENASVSSYSRVVVVLAGCTTENNDRLRFFKELFCLESGKYEIASHSFPSLGFYSHPRLRLRERKRSSSLLHIRKFFSCNNDLISKKWTLLFTFWGREEIFNLYSLEVQLKSNHYLKTSQVWVVLNANHDCYDCSFSKCLFNLKSLTLWKLLPELGRVSNKMIRFPFLENEKNETYKIGIFNMWLLWVQKVLILNLSSKKMLELWSNSNSHSSGWECYHSPIIDQKFFMFTSHSQTRTIKLSTSRECDVIFELLYKSLRPPKVEYKL